MPTTLNSGLQLPDKGSVDWYSSMQTNYNLLDNHLENTDIHVTAEDKANWNSKQGSLSQAQLDAIAQVATNTSDIATLQSGKADASHTHSSSDITDIGDYATKQYVDDSISGLVDNAPAALDTLKELSTALNDDANFASTVTTALAAKADSADLATVATSGSYNDLSNKPTINDSTITIQKNGSTVDTFTTNGSNKTINIPVPTKTSDITNDSNFVDTSNSAVASGITSAKVTDYDTHIADTDIHVTTADKTKWNNGVSQSYVFRYSSTALVASSTNSNTLLDNTDNLKVGDKVIDSSGVLFSITAIDTQNSTFSIGTALVDLLSSADVGDVALSNNYNDLDNLPTIPTVNDAVLTIQKNGVNVQTFTANASSDVTCNITVPTKTSELTNDSGFLTSHQSLSSCVKNVVTNSQTIKSTAITRGTAPSSTQTFGIPFSDNNNKYIGNIYGTFASDMSTCVGLYAYKGSTTLNSDNVSVRVGYDASGNAYTYAPTPAITDNSTQIATTAFVKALDSDVVHKSGNETVGGIKSFSDDTYITSLNFTNEVPSPSSSSSSILPIITTITYGDSSPSVQARLNLRITADGVKSLYPHENNQYALGLTSRKWSEVHATTYYYGSSDVEFSNKFVTTDTNQNIGGNKTLLNPLTLKGSYILWKNNTVTKGTIPATSANIYRMYLGDAPNYGNSLFNMDCNVGNEGIQRFTIRSAENVVNGDDARLFVYYNPNRAQPRYVATRGNIEPYNSDTYECGTSVNRWSTFNGLNPSALSMPDLSNGIDISSYITLPNTHNTYTPSVNGWISIILKSTAGALGLYIYQGDLSSSQYSSTSLPNETEPCAMCCLPVVGNIAVSIDTKGSNAYVVSAKFFPCQGNV